MTTTETMTSLAARIEMPYTLTPGEAAGIFLAELAKRRLIGSRHGDRILLPAQDFDGATGEPATGYVELAPAGSLEAFTVTPDGVLGLILVDGADVPFLHRVIGFAEADLEVGARVTGIWSDHPSGSVLDLAGFGPADDEQAFEPRTAPDDLAKPIERIDYTMTLDYQHSYGHYYGTFFDAVRTDRRLRGVKCSRCRRVLLPPRALCDVCYAPTAEWVDVQPIGVVQACSVVHIEFIGQRTKPPYVYAEIVLDGTSTRLIHQVGGIDPEKARSAVKPGSRVRAVWSDRRTGSLADIEYFELVGEQPS